MTNCAILHQRTRVFHLDSLSQVISLVSSLTECLPVDGTRRPVHRRTSCYPIIARVHFSERPRARPGHEVMEWMKSGCGSPFLHNNTDFHLSLRLRISLSCYAAIRLVVIVVIVHLTYFSFYLPADS